MRTRFCKIATIVLAALLTGKPATNLYAAAFKLHNP